MARQASRTPRWLLGLAVPATVSLLAAGCDTDAGKADKSVEATLDHAAVAADPGAAHRDLDTAAKDTSASLPVQARAKALLAASELQSALTLSQTAAANSAEIDRLAREITGLTRAIAADNQLVVTLGRYQPQPILDALKQQSTAIAGSDDKPDWVKTDSGTLSSTAATDKAVATAQAQISQLEQQIKSETDQRNDLMTKSDQLNQQSEREQHQKSVDLFTQGADARKQAADLAVKIDQDNGQLTSAKADLAVLTAQQEALKAAASAIDNRVTAVNTSWAAVGDQIKAIKAHSTTLMGDAMDAAAVTTSTGKSTGTKVPVTMNGKVAELDQLVKANKAIRDEAATHFNAAVGFYEDAYKRATEVKTALATKLAAAERPDRADREAWSVEKDAIDPSQFQFLASMAQLDQAGFFARAAGEAKTLAALSANVKPVLDTAGLPVPAGLDDAGGDATAAVAADQKQADGAYKDAVDKLGNVTDGDAPSELKHGAYVGTMLAQYGWSLLTTAAGDATGTTTHMEAARTARDNALQGGTLPPMLPEALVPAPAAAAPGAGPAAAPAMPK